MLQWKTTTNLCKNLPQKHVSNMEPYRITLDATVITRRNRWNSEATRPAEVVSPRPMRPVWPGCVRVRQVRVSTLAERGASKSKRYHLHITPYNTWPHSVVHHRPPCHFQRIDPSLCISFTVPMSRFILRPGTSRSSWTARWRLRSPTRFGKSYPTPLQSVLSARKGKHV